MSALRPSNQLIHGPYRPLKVRIGQILTCEIRGELVVGGFSDGRIPWPLGKRGRPYGGRMTYIVCQDLARAVEREALVSVCYWWGVHRATARV